MWTPRTRSLALLLALSLATPLLCLPSAADAGFLERALRRLVGKVRIEPKTLVLDLRDDLEPEELAAFGRKYGIKLTPNSPHSRADRFFTIKTGLPDILLRRLITRLRKDPAVARAERAYLYHALDFPNDPYFKQQWNITMAGARSAWRWSRGERVTVAVIDTGVTAASYTSKAGVAFRRVPDLDGACFVPGYDFINNTVTAGDDNGHGTHVAGTIAQSTDNKLGVAGLAFRACIMPIKALTATGTGTNADIAEAIRFAARKGAQVINLSVGGWDASGVLGDAVKYALGKGVVVVSSAGNSGSDKKHYPAAFPGVIAVSAVGPRGNVTGYSSFGKWITLAAPGGEFKVGQAGAEKNGILQNTISVGQPARAVFQYFQGTSMAAPHVAAAAAMLIAQGINDPATVRSILRGTAANPSGKKLKYGAGIVNAGGAVFFAGFWIGMVRLLLAVALALFFFSIYRRHKQNIITDSFSGGVPFWGGVVMGSSGLFFLPLITGWLSYQALWTQGVPAWGLAFFGPGGHMNPILASAAVPVGLVALFGPKRNHRLIIGLSIGIAAHLLLAGIYRTADVRWIPNLFGTWLDRAWLIGNGLAAYYVAVLCGRRR